MTELNTSLYAHIVFTVLLQCDCGLISVSRLFNFIANCLSKSFKCKAGETEVDQDIYIFRTSRQPCEDKFTCEDRFTCYVMPRWGQKIKHQVKRAFFAGSENHSDLDSDAAFATDAKFSEILRSKQNTLGKQSRISCNLM